MVISVAPVPAATPGEAFGGLRGVDPSHKWHLASLAGASAVGRRTSWPLALLPLLPFVARRAIQRTRKYRRLSSARLADSSEGATLETTVAGPLVKTEVFEVPLEWRRVPGRMTGRGNGDPTEIDWDAAQSAERPPFFKYCSLAEVFPGEPKLAEVFNGNADFRRRIREACREDLFVPIERLSPEENEALLALDSSIQAGLAEDKGNGRRGLRQTPRLTEVFRDAGLGLVGQAFFARILGLCRDTCSGDWMDIVGSTRSRRHGWHQDTARGGWTVMLGFPPSTGYQGEGVFSHAARISHRLRPDKGVPIVVEWELPEASIFRPVYAPGQELIVYNDAALLHSAPDVHNRESVMRFM